MGKKYNTNNLTLLALLFALAIVLMLIENLIPPIPTLPPGVKIGLSNIVLMYCLFFINKKSAFVILMLKSLFVLITRGLVYFLFSFFGGFLSLIITIILLSISNNKISYLALSIISAITHNMAQLIVCVILLKEWSCFYYAPILIISGIVMGSITGIVLRVMIPAMKRVNTN